MKRYAEYKGFHLIFRLENNLVSLTKRTDRNKQINV